MTIDELRSIGIIRNIRIQKMFNQHSFAEIRMWVENDRLEDLNDSCGEELLIDDDERIYMRGLIEEIETQTSYAGSEVFTRIHSNSVVADRNRHNRVFQSTEKTLKEICMFLHQMTVDCRYDVAGFVFANDNLEEFLVQDNMTDFEFMRQLVNSYGFNLIVADAESDIRIRIGDSLYDDETLLQDEDVFTLRTSRNLGGEKCFIKTKKYLDLGQYVTFKDCSYVVTSALYEFQDDLLMMSFELTAARSEELSSSGQNMKMHIFGDRKARMQKMLGKAKVVSNEDPEKLGRIQVEFLEYKDCIPRKRRWIHYLPNMTEGAQGFVMIPDPDEIVHVFLDGDNCYCNGCVRKEQIDSRIENIRDRVILLRDNQVLMNENAVKMKAFDWNMKLNKELCSVEKLNMKMQLTPEKLFVEQADFRILADHSKIALRKGNSFVSLTDDAIQLKTSAGLEICMNGDGDQLLITNGNSKEVLAGGSIELQAPDSITSESSEQRTKAKNIANEATELLLHANKIKAETSEFNVG